MSRKRFKRWMRHKHRGHGGFPWVYPWVGYGYGYPWWYGYSYPYAYDVVDEDPWWTQPASCAPPLVNGCTQLNVTGEWATACFYPRYQELREVYGTDYDTLASALARAEAPDCPWPAQTGASAEFLRRVQLAVAVLLNAEGVPVPYPSAAQTPRPPNADSIAQPWLRALLTGWV